VSQVGLRLRLPRLRTNADVDLLRPYFACRGRSLRPCPAALGLAGAAWGGGGAHRRSADGWSVPRRGPGATAEASPGSAISRTAGV